MTDTCLGSEFIINYTLVNHSRARFHFCEAIQKQDTICLADFNQ